MRGEKRNFTTKYMNFSGLLLVLSSWMKTTQLNCLKPQYYYYYQRKMPFSSTLSSVNFLKMDIAPFSFKVLKKLFLCNL